jgi:hypothetical protein
VSDVVERAIAAQADIKAARDTLREIRRERLELCAAMRRGLQQAIREGRTREAVRALMWIEAPVAVSIPSD